MEIVVTGRHTQIKQRFRDVVESKMNRVTAIAPDAQRVQIVLSHEGNPRQADTAKRVEITVIAGRTVVRAEASSADEFSALDLALDKLTLRLRRTRDRRKDHRRGYTDPVRSIWARSSRSSSRSRSRKRRTIARPTPFPLISALANPSRSRSATPQSSSAASCTSPSR